EEIIETSLAGQLLLEYPLLNKGMAFSIEERYEFGLVGLLPAHVSTVEQQLVRNYENFKRKESDIERYIFLAALQDRNETLFYRFVQEHIREMMPIIYTPVVGAACERYSHLYRRPRGLYIPYPNRHEIDLLLKNAPVPNVEVIVVTDGERVLGLGDLGVGGMGIPVGKLALYTLCAGIHPATTLPVLLDVGTDNQSLLDDPLYVGWRHPRMRGAEYDDFIEAFIEALLRRFPDVLLQWEDFARENAGRLLERYRDRLCTFNDDIQGTGAVTLAGLLAAVKVTGSRISRERIVMLGAGSAASGICNQIVAAMISEGLSEEEARRSIWLVDRDGLVHSEEAGLEGFKKKFAQPIERLAGWDVARLDRITLEETVRHVRPTILIGTAAQPLAFTEQVVREMTCHAARPVIFPLSNPISKCEAVPSDLIIWTEGRALVATGSPFADVSYGGRSTRIGQCNNAYIFPGMGLGVIASGARRVTDQMFVAAARALSQLSPVHKDPTDSLFPPLEQVRDVSRRVAFDVAVEAQRAGLAEPTSEQELERRISAKMWASRYLRYRKAVTGQ
ncbi:MAG TPA: NAD-dependent malic enzyme, partial [Blastocatellia bacterium]|nr:NAD-dependent malic enzyme [Blastocatellia bacterium]